MHVDKSLRQELKIKYGDEQIFIVPLSATRHIKDKFTATDKKFSEKNILKLREWDSKGRYIFRSDAEYNVSFQQLIPYVIITNIAETKFYVSERISGDSRLQNTFSLGFGGHINPVDGTENVILAALKREFNEEVKTNRKNLTPNFIGSVRDLSSPTKEHLGFVFTVHASSVRIKEKHALKGRWMTLQELVDNYHKFESWAKYIIDYYFVKQQESAK